MASTTIVENLQADSVKTTELNAGNAIFTGKARFVQPIYADIDGAQDINSVQTGSISNSSYVMFSNGTNLFRVLYSDLITDLSSKITIDIPSGEGVGY